MVALQKSLVIVYPTDWMLAMRGVIDRMMERSWKTLDIF
jgi:hypothetical protein